MLLFRRKARVKWKNDRFARGVVARNRASFEELSRFKDIAFRRLKDQNIAASFSGEFVDRVEERRVRSVFFVEIARPVLRRLSQTEFKFLLTPLLEFVNRAIKNFDGVSSTGDFYNGRRALCRRKMIGETFRVDGRRRYNEL